MDNFDFNPPPPRTVKETKISMISATVIFKEVADISVDEAKHFIKHNLGGTADGYSAFTLARLIRAYLKHAGHLKNL